MPARAFIALLSVIAVIAITGCGGGESTSPSTDPTSEQISDTPNSAAATLAPSAADGFCAGIPAADVESLAGDNSVLTEAEPDADLGRLATCRYLGDAALLSVHSLSPPGYEIQLATNLRETQGAEWSAADLVEVGDEAKMFWISDVAFTHEGKPYTGQTILLARTAARAVSISVLTNGEDVETARITALAQELLQ
ncbi:MAG: hypothetical protein WEB04_09130 [Dehalococcoidia bacterium]